MISIDSHAYQDRPGLQKKVWFRRNQIRLSELTGSLFAVLIFFCLSMLGAAVLIREHKIKTNYRKISHLTGEQVVLKQNLLRLREQEMIISSLEQFGRGRFSLQTIKLLADLVYKNSFTYGYDPMLLLAVIYVESRFSVNALGQFRSGNFSGAIGLMQIKYETAREIAHDLNIEVNKPSDVFEPETNITLGVGYLTRCISRFNSLKLGILAYNQGPDVIRESISAKKPLSEDYYRKVLTAYFRLKDAQRKTGSDS
jgi:hypothetical protein